MSFDPDPKTTSGRRSSEANAIRFIKYGACGEPPDVHDLESLPTHALVERLIAALGITCDDAESPWGPFVRELARRIDGRRGG